MKDNPNLFLELVAWRRLGFNALEMISNKHTLAPNVGAGGFKCKNVSNSTENNERHVFPMDLRLKLEQ